MSKDGRSERPTIHEVARRAGVSKSSVSRALLGQTTNQEILQRVNDAVRELGYVPNMIAQSFKQQSTGQVAFAMEDIGNPFYLAAMRAIQPILKAANVRLVLHSTDGIVEDEINLVNNLGKQFVDGLILCPIRVTDELLAALSNAPVPVVVLGTLPDGVEIDHVRSDSYRGAALGTTRLLETGCRELGFIGGPLDTRPGSARLEGFRDSVAHTAGTNTATSIADGFTYEDGVKATVDLLHDMPNVEGILTANDTLALGCLSALRTTGRAVPDVVRVIGMDDTNVAETSFPALTSVNLGATSRGAKAAELLLQRIANPGARPACIDYTASLTIRETA